MSPWSIIRTLLGLSTQTKQELDLSDEAIKIASSTSSYEQKIKGLWEIFKQNPTEENAQRFIDALGNLADEEWEALFKSILNVENLTEDQKQFLEEQINQNKWYMQNSLLPDLLKEVGKGPDAFNKFDYRVVLLYAGALWSFGFLSTITWDGLDFRDLGDLFIFLGPDDENTCTGKRGCDQYVGKIFTVAQIIKDTIIPGTLKCGTNCRHMLLPIASPL